MQALDETNRSRTSRTFNEGGLQRLPHRINPCAREVRMPHHRRLEEPDRYYLLSNRTHRGEYLFRPDDECNRILRGCLARQVVRKNVRLVAFAVLSNHFHLVAGFPGCNRAAFMRDLQREWSRRITNHRGTDGGVFSRPYHPQTLLDAEKLLEAISYTVNNPVRHGLVSRPKAWPGLESSKHIKEAKSLTGQWLDHDAWHNFQRRKEPPSRSKAMVEFSAPLHIPDLLPGDDEEERRAAMVDAVEEGRKEFCRKAGLDRHRRPDDPDRYKRVEWRTRQTVDEDWCDIRRACVGSESGHVADYLERRREIDRQYRRAANQWKDGELATFPVGTYPPGRSKPVESLEPRAPPG